MASSPYLSHAVIWSCFTPIALISCILALVALSHFRRIYRSLDILLLSFIASLFLQVLLLMPVFLAVIIDVIEWPVILCKFFIWCFVSTRMIAIITLISLSLDGVLMLRVPGRYRVYGIVRSRTVQGYVVASWVLACFTGFVPLIGWSRLDFVTNNVCHFLPYEIGASFSIFLSVMEFTGIIMAMICLTDAYFCLKHARNSYHFSTSQMQQPKSVLNTIDSNGDKKSMILGALDFTKSALDSWAATCTVCCVSYAINHLPFMLISVTGAVAGDVMNHTTVTSTLLWLLLIEACVLPQFLWLVSVRYRHAYYYEIIACLCREKKKDEDEYCKIQLYHKRVQVTGPYSLRKPNFRQQSYKVRAGDELDGDIYLSEANKTNGLIRRDYNVQQAAAPPSIVFNRSSSENTPVRRKRGEFETQEMNIEVANAETLPVRGLHTTAPLENGYFNQAYEPDQAYKPGRADEIVLDGVKLLKYSKNNLDPIVIRPGDDGTVRRQVLPREPSPDYSLNSHDSSGKPPSFNSVYSESDEEEDSGTSINESDIECVLGSTPQNSLDRPITNNVVPIIRSPTGAILGSMPSTEIPRGRSPRRASSSSSRESFSDLDSYPSAESLARKRGKYKLNRIHHQSYDVTPIDGVDFDSPAVYDDDDTNTITNLDEDPNKPSDYGQTWKSADKTLSLMEFLMTKEEGLSYMDTGESYSQYAGGEGMKEQAEVSAFL